VIEDALFLQCPRCFRPLALRYVQVPATIEVVEGGTATLFQTVFSLDPAEVTTALRLHTRSCAS
jgi:hypothetical protein